MNNDSNTTATRRGGPACSVCIHPRCDEFDRALLSERMSQADVAREVGCHRSTVNRHVKNHLLPRAAEQLIAAPEMAGLNIVGELESLYQRMKNHLERAEAADNWRAIRAFHAEARQDLELLAKLLGELQEQRPTVNILVASPEWLSTRRLLLDALAPHPEARAAVSQALLEAGDAG